MRFGGPLFADKPGPEGWIAELRRWGYGAAYCPVDETAEAATVQAYADAAAAHDIVIAEVGAWSNPLSRDEAARRKAIAFCQTRLALAESIGARCCVNIAGSRGEKWDGPHPDDLTPDTFDAIVETTRGIIDAVQPTRTFYTLEPMPWMYPNSIESYERLLQAIDRRACAVHFDPVNLITSPELYFNQRAFVREFVERLGPHIKSCHAKDICLGDSLTVHLSEARPGLGALDYAALLRELGRLDPDTPVMLEHLPGEADYAAAADYVRGVARREHITFVGTP